MKNQTKIGMTYRKLPATAKIAIVNQRKRVGDVMKVAEATGFSPNYVSEVLNGIGNNSKVLNKAFDMARGRKRNQFLIG